MPCSPVIPFYCQKPYSSRFEVPDSTVSTPTTISTRRPSRTPFNPTRLLLGVFNLLSLAQHLFVVRGVLGIFSNVLSNRQDCALAVKDLGDLFEHETFGLRVVKVDHDDGEENDGNVYAIVLPRERTCIISGRSSLSRYIGKEGRTYQERWG